mgnify:CR=1 FL=1
MSKKLKGLLVAENKLPEVVEIPDTLKSLQENGLGATNADLDYMRKGVIEFHGVYYTIDNIIPKAYIADVFLMYTFECTEDKHTTSVLVEEEGE